MKQVTFCILLCDHAHVSVHVCACVSPHVDVPHDACGDDYGHGDVCVYAHAHGCSCDCVLLCVYDHAGVHVDAHAHVHDQPEPFDE